jgi:transposase
VKPTCYGSSNPHQLCFRTRTTESHYGETGRPSIDPELLLRILLIGYLYGISSERKLVEELRMHLAWRWFTDLGFDQEIPHHLAELRKEEIGKGIPGAKDVLLKY